MGWRSIAGRWGWRLFAGSESGCLLGHGSLRGTAGTLSGEGVPTVRSRQRPWGLATRARRVRLRRQQPKQGNATTRRLAVMNLALRGIEADFGPEHADPFRRGLHPDLRADEIFQMNNEKWRPVSEPPFQRSVRYRLAANLGRSNRSRFITLFHAATKSWTNFGCESADA